MSTDSRPRIPSANGEPAWEAAYFFPPQGRWSEEDFLRFHSNRMAELVDGRLELLPMPTLKHQRILILLLDWMRCAVEAGPGGLVMIAPLPTKLFPGTIREPDLLYIAPENRPGADVDYPSRIDLAVEIVSPGGDAQKRDYEDKRTDYAKAGVAEYWIVDPQQQRITVLVLSGESYSEYGIYTAGETASGKLLPDLRVDVDTVMNT